ncbi:MAG: hypothetical protein GY754_29440 [bacterium]|nr:hypothetical protein [bacterium]
MEEVKALLVFCEGAHDVAFCRLVFKYYYNIKKIDWKFSEYPAPFNQLFKASVEKHSLKDLSLDMAKKFFLPNWTLYSEKNNLVILLFNTGGKEYIDNPKKFLAEFIPLLDQVTVFPDDASKIVHECQYLFFYDRDYHEPEKIFRDCKDKLSRISLDDDRSVDFITEDFSIDNSNDLAAACMNKKVGAYIFSSPGSMGTLEDILLPIYRSKNEDLFDKTTSFIDSCFSWKTEDEKSKTRISARAGRKKAIICTAGQGKKPGRPLSAIIDDDVLGSNQAFKANDSVKAFAEFLADFADLI